MQRKPYLGTPKARYGQTAETKDKEKMLKAARAKRYTQRNNNKIDRFHSLN